MHTGGTEVQIRMYQEISRITRTFDDGKHEFGFSEPSDTENVNEADENTQNRGVSSLVTCLIKCVGIALSKKGSSMRSGPGHTLSSQNVIKIVAAVISTGMEMALE